jgi:hypothetical protein
MNTTIYMLYAICDMRHSRGRLIGVNTMIYSPSGASAGIGFAIPSDTGPAAYSLPRCRTAYKRCNMRGGICSTPPHRIRSLALRCCKACALDLLEGVSAVASRHVDHVTGCAAVWPVQCGAW